MKSSNTHLAIPKEQVEIISKKLLSKFRKSFAIFIITNLAIFILIGLITVFNLFALRFHHDERTLVFFLIIGILTNVAAFFRAILAVFKFKQLYNLNLKKMNYMSEELRYYKAKKFEYSKKNSEFLFLEKIKMLFNADDLD